MFWLVQLFLSQTPVFEVKNRTGVRFFYHMTQLTANWLYSFFYRNITVCKYVRELGLIYTGARLVHLQCLNTQQFNNSSFLRKFNNSIVESVIVKN